jgi:mRNA interferase MazF
MNDFDRWSEKKQQIHQEDRFFYYREREVWWCSIGMNIGVEVIGKNQNFERPVLILCRFNKDMFWGIPLTSKKKVGSIYSELTHERGKSWAILSQMRLFSTKRLLRKIGRVSKLDFEKTQNQFISTIKKSDS